MTGSVYKSDGGAVKTAVAVGKFDGVHRGHAKLLRRLGELARSRGLRGVALVFSPSPAEFFSGASSPSILLPEERGLAFERAGVVLDEVVVMPFDERVAYMSCEEFSRVLLRERLEAELVVVGGGFRFGKDASGGVAELRENGLKMGFGVEVVGEELFAPSGLKVSSAAIRSAVAEGRLREAREMLGYPYFFSGTVVRGRQIGRTIGFPTMNVLPAAGKVVPANGVYATRARIGGEIFNAMTNVGVNPTVSGGGGGGVAPIVVETHAFGLEGDFYGRHIVVDFFERVRDERRFSGIEELQRQINTDKKRTLDYFEAVGTGVLI